VERRGSLWYVFMHVRKQSSRWKDVHILPSARHLMFETCKRQQ